MCKRMARIQESCAFILIAFSTSKILFLNLRLKFEMSWTPVTTLLAQVCLSMLEPSQLLATAFFPLHSAPWWNVSMHHIQHGLEIRAGLNPLCRAKAAFSGKLNLRVKKGDDVIKGETKFTTVAVPAKDKKDEERERDENDWDGLAESRIAVFEANQKALMPDRDVAGARVRWSRVRIRRRWGGGSPRCAWPILRPPASGPRSSRWTAAASSQPAATSTRPTSAPQLPARRRRTHIRRRA